MMTSRIQYARSGDASIAYQVLGDGSIDLLVVPGIVSHIEAFRDLPGYSEFLESLAMFARVIVFDKRGNGLSDRVTLAPSLEERMDDVRAVLDACGSRRAAVLGVSEGAPLALMFAATRPERVRSLFLIGGFARLVAGADHPDGVPREAYEAFVERVVGEWGSGTALARIFGPSLGHSEDVTQIAARCERASATPTGLSSLWTMAASVDVRSVLPRVFTDTLVMHRAGDSVVPPRLGRALAAALPQASWLELPGDDHLPFVGDWRAVVGAIAESLGVAADPTVLERPGSRTPVSYRETRAPARVSTTPALEIGRFVVQRLLGSGGMGSVYLALDRDLGRHVALKVVSTTDDASLVRFRREANAVARLAHPNVVSIHELGLDAELPYLVLEYARGGSLQDVGRPVSWRRASRLMLGAARGLGAAHALGMVHRDVKPANLLLSEPGGDDVKVTDFGIAKLGDRPGLTEAGAIVGTPRYLSPEQARGEFVDARTDVYSLGLTWYELLTGQIALEGSAGELLRRASCHAIADPREHNAEVPRAVAELVMRFGALERSQRPADGAVAAEEIAQAIAPRIMRRPRGKAATPPTADRRKP